MSSPSLDRDAHAESSRGGSATRGAPESRLLTAFLSALLLHGVGLTALSAVGGVWRTVSAPSPLITTELVAIPPAAPVEPIPPPDLAAISPPKLAMRPESLLVTLPLALQARSMEPPPLEQITPPKLVQKTPVKPAPTPAPKKPVAKPRSSPPAPAEIAGDTEKPRSGPLLPLPVESPAAASGNVLGAPAVPPDNTPFQPAEGSASGAGQLFERGDAAVVSGAGAGGGAGGSGRVGFGTGGLEGSKPEAGLQPGAGGPGPGGGIGPLARPLGGYQVKPRYPESARRRGIEGTTLLKIYVNDNGRVQDVLVERSAGHEELDAAAMEAVKRWRFDPARRGNQPVAVWVMLPVRFELR